MTASARGTVEEPGRREARRRRLNRAIPNVAWHRIQAMLACKAARFVTVDLSDTSRTCASCGTVDGRSRESQAVDACTACGHRDNSDRNAAVTRLDRGTLRAWSCADGPMTKSEPFKRPGPLGNLRPSGRGRCQILVEQRLQPVQRDRFRFLR